MLSAEEIRERQRIAGHWPFFVPGNVRLTPTGAVDPVGESSGFAPANDPRSRVETDIHIIDGRPARSPHKTATVIGNAASAVVVSSGTVSPRCFARSMESYPSPELRPNSGSCSRTIGCGHTGQ